MKLKYSIILPTLCFLLVFYGCAKDNPEAIPSNATFAEKIDITDIHAADIPSLFAAEKVRYNTVSTLNWREQFPYLPQVDFAIAHNGHSLLIHYRVTEKRTIGTMENDLEALYKNSCCEFFCMEKGDGLYYNIESNCLGHILMECGTERADREISTRDNLAKIDRWASLGRNSVGTIDSETHWELALVVPTDAFWRHDFSTLSGRTFLANIYNCVGGGDDRQYVTWYPVNTPAPDFHRPEFFHPIYFK